MNLLEVKEQIARLEKDCARAEGSLESLKARLQEFGYKSVSEAKQALQRMKDKEQHTRKEVDRELQQFEEKWGELLRQTGTASNSFV